MPGQCLFNQSMIDCSNNSHPPVVNWQNSTETTSRPKCSHAHATRLGQTGRAQGTTRTGTAHTGPHTLWAHSAVAGMERSEGTSKADGLRESCFWTISTNYGTTNPSHLIGLFPRALFIDPSTFANVHFPSPPAHSMLSLAGCR